MKRLALGALFLTLTSACRDPVLDAKIEALGPDPGPYEKGEKHRAGFPCTWCHSRAGGKKPHFDLAGTIYADPDAPVGMPGVTVRLFDGEGRQMTRETNEVGTFFVEEGDLKLSFPIWVRLEHGEETRLMTTPIFRERSCAGCHRDPAGPGRRGRIHLRGEP